MTVLPCWPREPGGGRRYGVCKYSIDNTDNSYGRYEILQTHGPQHTQDQTNTFTWTDGWCDKELSL